MKLFRFQQFDIQQNADVFRVGTDAVLLGALANVSKAKNVLEIGTGTGIVSLMIAQRNLEAKILAILKRSIFLKPISTILPFLTESKANFRI